MSTPNLPETSTGHAEPPEFLSKVQVASLLNVSKRTVDSMIARGELPVARLSKRLLRFPRQAVIEAVNRRVVGRR